jgi:hypothetical protein
MSWIRACEAMSDLVYASARGVKGNFVERIVIKS